MLLVDALFVLGLVMVAVSWWLCGFPWIVGVLVRVGLVSVAVRRLRMYCRMLVVGLRRGGCCCGDGSGERLVNGPGGGIGC